MSPPKKALAFLRWFCREDYLEEIEGDLTEVFKKHYQISPHKAKWKFAWSVIRYFRPEFIKSFRNSYQPDSYGMYKSYFKVALRNLWRYKGYSFINIFGLSIGIAAALLISLWVQYQLSFDDFHVNKQRIVMVMKKTFFNNVKGTQTGIMLPLYDELKGNYPEVKHITRLDWGNWHGLNVGEKKMGGSGHFADPDFLKMFTFPLVKGNVDNVLKEPYSIVLTESLAVALFGEEDPIGKMILVDNAHNVTVTGILKDVPTNSSISFQFLLPYELNVLTSEFVRKAKDQWQNNFLQNFVELNDGVSATTFSDRIEMIERNKSGDKKASTLFVHPMERWHLYSRFEDWVNTGGAIESVRMFAIIGLLVLAIACINFMNLSTARSEKRAREVAIRKTIGSQRKQLIVQFLGESLIVTFIAFIISLPIIHLSLPSLAGVGFENVQVEWNNISILSITLAGVILTGLIAGCYPALLLSRFTPVRVLKGPVHGGKSADLPRKILVVTQFTFSITLIISTIIVFRQIQHAKDRPLGYTPDNLISMYLSPDLLKNYQPLKNDLLATGYVEAISRASSPMTDIYNDWDGFTWEGKDPNSNPIFSAILVDYDYDITSGIRLKQGRFFSPEFVTDSTALMINEAAMKVMGFETAVGNVVKYWDAPMTVIGVYENVVMDDPFQPVGPAVMMLSSSFRVQGFIRIKDNVDLRKALAAIKPVVEKYNPSSAFDYRFTDEEFAKKFSQANQTGQLAGIFTVLSVLISCLGMFGLASFMAERRTKEISIRKVMGASHLQLWKMLSRDFVVLVIISCFIALPTGYYFMNNWLQRYEYRTDISWWVFLVTGASALAITLLTVSVQTIKATLMNPVKSLRSE